MFSWRLHSCNKIINRNLFKQYDDLKMISKREFWLIRSMSEFPKQQKKRVVTGGSRGVNQLEIEWILQVVLRVRDEMSWRVWNTGVFKTWRVEVSYDKCIWYYTHNGGPQYVNPSLLILVDPSLKNLFYDNGNCGYSFVKHTLVVSVVFVIIFGLF